MKGVAAESNPTSAPRLIVACTNALAIKRGQTVDEVREFLALKAAAKFKRENR